VNYIIASSGNDNWLTQIGWRYMFLSGAIPAAIFLILLFFVPETPRHLVSVNKEHKALAVLRRITKLEHAEIILSEIRETMHQKNVRWLSYGGRVIIIGIMLSVFQQFIGINVVLYYAGNIFRNMGFDANSSLLQTIVVGAVNLVFTTIAIIYVDRLGRKPLLIIGALGMALSMIALGIMFYCGSLGVGALIFMLIYVAAFAVSWGPVVWVMLAEIFPNSIRGAMSIAVSAQWIANWLVSFTFPMLNDNITLTHQFHHALAYFIYGIMGILAAIFVYKFVPETKHKSLEEIEQLWHKE
jgi:MFS transporter, SP family, xylose:H+ symportor